MAELPDLPWPDPLWEWIRARMTPGQAEIVGRQRQYRARASRYAGVGEHQYHRADEPHPAFVEPGTGRMLDTAECQELLRRLRHG